MFFFNNFLVFYRLWLDFHVKYVLFMWKLNRDDSGIVHDLFKSCFLSVVHAASASFPAKYGFLDLGDMLNLKKLNCCWFLVIFHHIDAIRARWRTSKNEQKNKKLLGVHQAHMRLVQPDCQRLQCIALVSQNAKIQMGQVISHGWLGLPEFV